MAHLNLFQELDLLRREVDQAFRGLGRDNRLPSSLLTSFTPRDYPRLNVSEQVDHFEVTALLPGLKAEDIELNALGNTLTLAGERKVGEISNGTWHRQERGYGAFRRTLELPSDIAAEKITASYKNGLLHIHLPKAEELKARKIAIEG
ncbi:MAG: Hsp20/alpha crystallin family protein [Desulfuromonadaceae bacterium]|nr:Hsp20/alpha crystallin family protein [Desulfuromonadaceae bacterium]